MKRLINKVLLVLLLAATCSRSYAQFDFPVIGGSSVALGGVTTTVQDPQVCTQNPAVLGIKSQSIVGIGLQQNFLTEGLSHKNILVTYQTKHSGGMGLDYHHFGNEGYFEQKLSFAYGLATGKRMALGITLDYLHSGTEDAHYTPQQMLTFGVGTMFLPSHRIKIGVAAYNPTSVKLHTEEPSRVPARLKAGIGYQLCDELEGHIEIEQRMTIRTISRIGLEYNYHKKLFARVGFCSYPSTWTFGIGYKATHYGVDMGMQTHMQLGISSQISAYYQF